MMGGPGTMEKFLDLLFNSSSEMAGREQVDITGVIGQYAHGNEPSHHAAYLYNFVGKPDKTQEVVKKIMTELYSSQSDGLCGNEDCGQMSAWFVLSAMGFYPVCPGNNQYVIGYPLFDKVVLRLENGKTLTITKDKDKPYIQSATLNGKPLTRSFITYDEIASGGVLAFSMGDKPGDTWGKGNGNMPVTQISLDKRIVPVPVFTTDKVSFQDQTRVALYIPQKIDKSRMIVEDQKAREAKMKADVQKEATPRLQAVPAPSEEDITIYYTSDGSTPSARNGKKYTEPILINKDVTIKAIAVNGKGKTSQVAEAHYVRYTRDKDLTYITKPNPQYFAGGDAGLIDNLRGIVNYRIGGWQGFTTDCELVIDLRTAKPIKQVGAGCLEEQRAWIFYPRSMEVYISENGKDYTLFGKKELKVERADGAHIQDVEVNGNADARYVKIVIKNYGKLPEWHISAGQQSWLFVDEVWVK